MSRFLFSCAIIHSAVFTLHIYSCEVEDDLRWGEEQHGLCSPAVEKPKQQMGCGVSLT